METNSHPARVVKRLIRALLKSTGYLPGRRSVLADLRTCVIMTTGLQSRKSGTSKGSEKSDGGDGSTSAAMLTKLDKSGLYDQQQVKRLLDDQVIAVRIVHDISRNLF
jgi:hypothetical protein